MKKKFIYIFLILFLAECNRKVAVPAYIHLEKFQMKTDYVKFGSAQNAIIDAWVYVNGISLGAYELPVTFPVVDKGNCHLQIFPGIKIIDKNVSMPLHLSYPLYSIFDTTILLKENTTDSIIPNTKYNDGVILSWVEDFEFGKLQMKNNSGNTIDTMQIIKDSARALENHFGQIICNLQDEPFEYEANVINALPGNGVETYIEVNYNTDMEVEFGFYIYTLSTRTLYPMVTAYPSYGWKKMYIRITEDVGSYLAKANSLFSVYLRGQNTDGAKHTVLFDNIKLIHR